MNDVTHRPDIRVYHIWVPQPTFSLLRILLLGVGGIVAFVVGYIVGFLVVYLIGRIVPPVTQLNWLLFTVAIGAGAACLVLWVWWLGTRPRFVPKRKAQRIRRLERLAKDGRAAARLPHRFVELQLLRKPLSRRLARRFVMPPGTVIVANGARLSQWPRPASNDVVFEPIEVPVDEDKLRDLINLNIEQQFAGVQTEWPDEGDSKRASAWEQTKEQLRRVGAYGGLFAWPLVAVLNIWRRGFTIQGIFWMVIGMIFVLSIIATVLYERKWFLIPGAMVRRVSPFYQRGSTVSVYNAEENGLLVEARSGQGFVVCDGEAHLFYCEGFAYWPVVAGWISAARRPTRAELDELIGS